MLLLSRKVEQSVFIDNKYIVSIKAYSKGTLFFELHNIPFNHNAIFNVNEHEEFAINKDIRLLYMGILTSGACRIGFKAPRRIQIVRDDAKSKKRPYGFLEKVRNEHEEICQKRR